MQRDGWKMQGGESTANAAAGSRKIAGRGKYQKARGRCNSLRSLSPYFIGIFQTIGNCSEPKPPITTGLTTHFVPLSNPGFTA
jgi:hypothetical protein